MPANFRDNPPSRRPSRTSNADRQQDATERGVPDDADARSAELQTVKKVLQVLRDGKMDVVGFLDALCWGNPLAITDSTTRTARTCLTHSDRLVGVVSRLLQPPRTSRGGSTAGGARSLLLPLILDTVKNLINEEMDVVVEKLKEESAEVTEKSILGPVIDEVQDTVRTTAPVSYSLVGTAAWSEKQEEQNALEDLAKASEWCGR